MPTWCRQTSLPITSLFFTRTSRAPVLRAGYDYRPCQHHKTVHSMCPWNVTPCNVVPAFQTHLPPLCNNKYKYSSTLMMEVDISSETLVLLPDYTVSRFIRRQCVSHSRDHLRCLVQNSTCIQHVTIQLSDVTECRLSKNAVQ